MKSSHDWISYSNKLKNRNKLLPSWEWEDLEYNWLVAPSIRVGKSLEKCSQGGKDAAIGNQGHEAGASFDLNIANIENKIVY